MIHMKIKLLSVFSKLSRDMNDNQHIQGLTFLWAFHRRALELSHNPAIPLLGIYPEKTIIQKESCTTMFIAALFTIARTWKQPKCSLTDEWIKKMWQYIRWNITQP